jgi:hypothetical protein
VQGARLFDGFVPVSGLTYDLDAVLGGEQGAQSFANYRVIINDQDTNQIFHLKCLFISWADGALFASAPFVG